MTRPSLLTVAQYCGHARRLAREFPEGSTVGVAGTTWHNRMADYVTTRGPDPEMAAAFATLPPHVRAEAEVPVALVDHESFEPLSEGTADVILTHDDGSITVVDWKTGSPDKVEPPDENLQLGVYGAAAATERAAPRYRVGLYFTQHPPLRLSRWMDMSDAAVTVERVRAANALDENEPIVGAHCNTCYRRTHCSAWTLPAFQGETALEPFTVANGLTKQNAPRALMAFLALRDVQEKIEARLKDWARANGGIEMDGKCWAPTVVTGGRRSVNLDAVPADLMPALEAAGAIRQGQPYEVFRWKNADRRKAHRG